MLNRLLIIFLLIFLPTIASAGQFEGENFSVKLPDESPGSTFTQRVENGAGEATSWKYEGYYEEEAKDRRYYDPICGMDIGADKDKIVYSIEVVKTNAFNLTNKTPRDIANQVLRFLFSASGTLSEVMYDAELDVSYLGMDAVGLEIMHVAPFGIFRSRVIVFPPYIWTLNGAAINKTENELSLIDGIFRSFRPFIKNKI